MKKDDIILSEAVLRIGLEESSLEVSNHQLLSYEVFVESMGSIVGYVKKILWKRCKYIFKRY